MPEHPKLEDSSEKPAKTTVRRISNKRQKSPESDSPNTLVESAAESKATSDNDDQDSQNPSKNRSNRRRRGKGKSSSREPESKDETVVEITKPEPVTVAQKPEPRTQTPSPIPPRQKLDPEAVTKKAWKIFLAEVSEEGVALISDNDARELSRRCFRLAEIFLEERKRRP